MGHIEHNNAVKGNYIQDVVVKILLLLGGAIGFLTL